MGVFDQQWLALLNFLTAGVDTEALTAATRRPAGQIQRWVIQPVKSPIVQTQPAGPNEFETPELNTGILVYITTAPSLCNVNIPSN